MKKILVAMDSYKGCMSSVEAGSAAAEALKIIYPDADISVFPVSDGGEGLTESLIKACNGTYEEVSITGPLGDSRKARYGFYINSEDSKCAIIEMAAAAGLTLVAKDKQNPLVTTTYGVGEMILDAYKKGCRSFIIGIGGSATNDVGVGMLSALGFRFLDKDGNEASRGAECIRDICEIYESDTERVSPDDLRKCKFTVACDVDNPLYGDKGCSMVFSLQKGATPDLAKTMDSWIEKYAGLVKKYYPDADENSAGAGAAGGLGYAFKTFLNAELKSGIDIVLNEDGFLDELKDAYLVITGEGKLDKQTAMGKVPVGVSRYAKKYDVRVIAFGGMLDINAIDELKEAGIDESYAITPVDMPIETAVRREVAIDNLKKKISEVLISDKVR